MLLIHKFVIMTKECILEIKQVYQYSLLIMIPVIVLIAGVYIVIWGTGFDAINQYYDSLEQERLFVRIIKGALIPFLVYNLGILIHEGIHACCFVLFSKNKFKTVRFGLDKKNLVPYVHCKEAIPLRKYRIALLAPTLILGAIPMAFALLFGNPVIWIYSFMFLIAGAVDMLVFFISLKVPKHTLVQDHPERIGFRYQE